MLLYFVPNWRIHSASSTIKPISLRPREYPCYSILASFLSPRWGYINLANSWGLHFFSLLYMQTVFSHYCTKHVTLPTKVHIVKAMFFPNSYIQLWELDHKEGWALKNWCFQTVVLKKTLESPLDSNKIKPIKPKGNQSWIFIGRTDAEAETPILWPPDAKSELSRKDLDAGKDWRQEERGITEDETVGWHHWLNGHEFEQTPGDGEGQGNLACWSPWGCKELDTT